jgi:hypothetical protein
VESLRAEMPRLCLAPDGWSSNAPWQSEADIPDEVYFRASAVF